MSKPSPQVALHYADYLKLAALLSIQQPESARHGRSAHDEMLFIIVHQTYELWFKQILHELDRIQLDFGGDVVEDEYLGRIVHGLERINEILKLLIQQLEVLETMTPLDFLDFRDFLFPASGFQSGQFRLIEIRLGLARGARSQYAGKPFDDTLTEADRSRIATAERGPKLIDQLDRWLSRTPFVHRPDYDFSLEYRKAVKQMLEDDAARVRANEAMGPHQREAEAQRIEASLEEFEAIFAPASGPAPWQMSRAAVQAAIAAAAAAAAGREAVCVSHQLPIWVIRRSVEGRPLWHHPGHRTCALASVTSFRYLDGQLTRISYAEPAGAGRPQVPGA